MEKYFIAAISAADQLGSRRVKKLIEIFGSAEEVWRAERGDLIKSRLPIRAVESLEKFRKEHPNAPEKLMDFCAAKKIGLCSIVDEDYPPILKEISSPPPIFYYRGILETYAKRIAIVGTRNNTPYGEKISASLGEELAAAGLTVVSGAARGIDSFAHRGALKSGRTVAVLGCGINYRLNSRTQKLLAEISERGLVMSEFEPNLQPNATTFPPRNRIIAGLSRGVIVVEAGKKSGALITTDFAGDFGRDVFAVPGNIFLQQSIGCHNLIRDGGILITSAEDVLEYYDLAVEKKSEKIFSASTVELDEREKKVFNLIPFEEEITADEILMSADEIEPNEISEILLQLEVKNLVKEDGGNYKRII